MKVEEQIQFNRLINLRTRLDKLEDGTVDQLLLIFFNAKNDLEQKLKKVKSPKSRKALRQIQKDLERSAATLSKLTTQNLNRNTAKMAGESLKGMDPIYSWDGKDVQYNTTLGLTDQVANTVQTIPVGGRHLAEWVDETFDNTLALQRTILASQLQGEGYRKVVNSLMAVYPQTERELITLARSYLQESVVAAQEALFEENDDIVKAVRWTAVMEIGFKSSGRGTCPRCAALDGTIYNKGDIRPPMTLHPRCRCMWSPITLSWDELFEKHRLKDKDGNPLTVPEMKQQNRKFVTRKEANIGTGRKAGNVEDVERIAGDFEDYVNQPGKYEVMKSTFGPNRAQLVKGGKVSVKDLVDRETGELFTLRQLGYPIKAKVPTPTTKKKPKKPKVKKPAPEPVAVVLPGTDELNDEQRKAVLRGLQRTTDLYSGEVVNRIIIKDGERFTARYSADKSVEINREAFTQSSLDDILNRNKRRTARLNRQIDSLRDDLNNYEGLYTKKEIFEINEKISFKVDALNKETTKFTVAETLEDIFVHETGHGVHTDLSFGGIKGVTDFLPPSKLRKMGIDFETTLGSKLDSIAFKHGSKVSEYASKNAEEYFAESWLLYTKSTVEAYKRVDLQLLEIFERIIK